MDTLVSSSARSACSVSWICGGMNSSKRTQMFTVQLSLRNCYSYGRNCDFFSSFKVDRESHVRTGMRRRSPLVTAAGIATEQEASDGSSTNSENDEISSITALLKTAVRTKKVPGTDICAAFKTLEKRKLDPTEFPSIIGGTKSPGRTWMLIFDSNKEQLAKPDGGGRYFPVTAVQRFDEQKSEIENGVFLGPLGSFTLTGGYSWSKRKMAFFFHTINLTVGPFGPFKIGIGAKDKEITKDDAFFLWSYADEEIIVSRGRGGGIALWVRCKNVKKSQYG